MKPLMILISICLLSSCYIDSAPANQPNSNNMPDNYEVQIIDGCEYLVYDNGLIYERQVHSIVHKGNCKNHKQ